MDTPLLELNHFTYLIYKKLGESPLAYKMPNKMVLLWAVVFTDQCSNTFINHI